MNEEKASGVKGTLARFLLALYFFGFPYREEFISELFLRFFLASTSCLKLFFRHVHVLEALAAAILHFLFEFVVVVDVF